MMYARAFDNSFAHDVRDGLVRAGQKTLPCRYFYDELGSSLFEAITNLPEYGLTRADERILQKHAAAIVERMPRNLIVAELGSGTGTKTRSILEKLRQRQIVVYYPIDTSGSALAKCNQDLGRLGAVFPLEMSYLDGLREVAARRAPGQPLLILFLGSTIGNFQPEAAIEFLQAIRQSLTPGDALLLGTDLVKPIPELLAAYDDPVGVTAAFNKNILARINRELEADFDLRQFDHVARYNQDAQRIEMHLRSREYQIVSIRKADLIVDFVPNETICTEASHKFRLEQVCEMAHASGFHSEMRWVDNEWPFAENLLIAV
jgi:L-histidine N-alpha-methyltransferase